MSYQTIYNTLLESFIKAVNNKDLLTEKLYNLQKMDPKDLKVIKQIPFNTEDIREYLGYSGFVDRAKGTETYVKLTVFFDKIFGIALVQKVLNKNYISKHFYCPIKFNMNESVYNEALEVLSDVHENRCRSADEIFRDVFLSGSYWPNGEQLIDNGFIESKVGKENPLEQIPYKSPIGFMKLLTANDIVYRPEQ